jgi:hypothetical protein
MVEREKRVRFAYDPVRRVHSYPMNTSILEERNCERFKDTKLSTQSSVHYSNEALKPTEGRRFGQSMNKCKVFCHFVLFVICLALCARISSLSCDVHQVPHQRIGSNESCANARHIEEVMAFSCFLAWLSATILYT